MKHQQLHRHASIRKEQQACTQHASDQLARQLSNSAKISSSSRQILIHKLVATLEAYPDDEQVSLASSLPILHAGGLLELLRSVDEAKDMLRGELQGTCHRMRCEAKFVYYLWQVLGEETVQAVEVKKMVYLFWDKRGDELMQILREMAGSPGCADRLFEAWRELKQTKLYYRPVRKHQKDNQDSRSADKENNHHRVQAISRKSTGKKISKKQSSKSFLSTNYLNLGESLDEQLGENKPIHERLYSQNLYKDREALKRLKTQQTQKRQLSQCTFHPETTPHRPSSHSKTKQIKNFEKTVRRLNSTQILQQKMNESAEKYYRGEGYAQNRNKPMNPPKFLSRQKKPEQPVLMSITFEINGKKNVFKIREKDTAREAAKRVAKIFGLNKGHQDQMEALIHAQIQNYHKNQLR